MESKATATEAPPFSVTSSMMHDGKTIPAEMLYYSMGCAGNNRSPDLEWSGAPEGTKSYALTMFDPDAPTGAGWSHWIAYDIPARFTSLEAGAGSHQSARLHGGLSGVNDFGDAHYDGPCPPPGDPPHHYHLTIYAIFIPVLHLREHATYAAFRMAIRGLVAARGEIVGLYGR
jgi:Raf kinase inhibitor-like YbhB/YbcL family protein